jgi:hypothetical protein
MYTWHWCSIARWSNIHETNIQEDIIYITSYLGTIAPSGPGLLHCWGFEITLRHTTLVRTPLGVGSAHRKDLYLHKTELLQRTDIHSAGCIRTRLSQPASDRTATPQTAQLLGLAHSVYRIIILLTTVICHFPACSFAARSADSF